MLPSLTGSNEMGDEMTLKHHDKIIVKGSQAY